MDLLLDHTTISIIGRFSYSYADTAFTILTLTIMHIKLHLSVLTKANSFTFTFNINRYSFYPSIFQQTKNIKNQRMGRLHHPKKAHSEEIGEKIIYLQSERQETRSWKTISFTLIKSIRIFEILFAIF